MRSSAESDRCPIGSSFAWCGRSEDRTDRDPAHARRRAVALAPFGRAAHACCGRVSERAGSAGRPHG